jgi:hypothetical protein
MAHAAVSIESRDSLDVRTTLQLKAEGERRFFQNTELLFSCGTIQKMAVTHFLLEQKKISEESLL